MTAAEFRTLRESLGLSGEQLAQMLSVRDRTIRRWESGEQPVPAGAATDLATLDAQIERAVLGAIDALQDAQDRAQGRPAEVVLLRYRTERDLARYRPDMAALPLPVHGALIDRVRLAIARLGIESRIVWMDGPVYEEWLGDRHDSETMRAQWGSEQIGEI